MVRIIASDDGFSLLELLVAIAILSLAVIPMIATQTTAIHSTTLLSEKAIVQIVAENVLTELTVSEIAPYPGILSGEQVQAGIDFSWTANIRLMLPNDIMSISLIVSRDGGKETLYKITGFRKVV